MSPSITSAIGTAQEWQAFPVGDEEYAVDVLRAVPPLGHGVAGEYLHAIGVLDVRTLILVDAEKLVGDSVLAGPAGS